jgi:hypothetical protein
MGLSGIACWSNRESPRGDVVCAVPAATHPKKPTGNKVKRVINLFMRRRNTMGKFLSRTLGKRKHETAAQGDVQQRFVVVRTTVWFSCLIGDRETVLAEKDRFA